MSMGLVVSVGRKQFLVLSRTIDSTRPPHHRRPAAAAVTAADSATTVTVAASCCGCCCCCGIRTFSLMAMQQMWDGLIEGEPIQTYAGDINNIKSIVFT